MLKCSEATQLLSESQDRKLRIGERVAVRMHLFICTACSNFEKHMHVLRRVTRAFRSHNKD